MLRALLEWVFPPIPSGTPTDPHDQCPECGHYREGRPVPESSQRDRLRRGKPLHRPECNSGFDRGFGDFESCRCYDPCHSERLVDFERPLGPFETIVRNY